jgi:hypothetical protein
LISECDTNDQQRTTFKLDQEHLDRYRSWAGDAFFRLSIGLEHADDLCADLERALASPSVTSALTHRPQPCPSSDCEGVGTTRRSVVAAAPTVVERLTARDVAAGSARPAFATLVENGLTQPSSTVGCSL